MEEGHVIMIIVVHADDIFAVGQKERCDKFGRDLNEKVPVKNLGELRWYSACFYQRDVERGLLKISQQRFAEELAAEYGVEWGQSVSLPVSVKLSDFDVFVDADYASKAADRRSVSGGLVMCVGGVCDSVFEDAEVRYAFHHGSRVWRFILPDVGMPCISVFEDNQGAIQIAYDPITNSNSKHIDARHHLIRELLERKENSITHVPTQFQHACFLTKAICKESFALHRDFVMNLQ
ncbi:unnamed protein product [Ectocarpus sp. CCAP 1310/34]|nr:unnamed protein product [Ectocarpus sp. CCAP 1310/34]